MDHIRELKGYDTLNYSRVIEAQTLEEAKELYWKQLDQEHEFEEYSSAARVNMDDIKFIDGVVEESDIVTSDPKKMPSRKIGYV